MSALKFLFASLILAVNTLVLVLAMVPVALVKLLFPTEAVRSGCDRALMGIAALWMDINAFWLGAVNRGRWSVEGADGLDPRGWYLVTSNHQSWVDIVVLQRVFNRRIPMLKFFTKKELLYVPVIGFAWWALDFPFMQRKGGASARADLEAGRKACAKFRLVPTSVMSFVEGTRFTAAKHAQQKSPYRHLLKPKVGGIGMALEGLGDAFTGFLDVTLVYPQGLPTFTDAMAGRLGDVVVRVHLRDVPAQVLPAPGEPAPRAAVQAWVNELWQAKDEEITRLLAERQPR
ncbi:acyltransferase [Simplicispira hankyongi]|jgi:1-acyl-sn-glycerol-3-phosphate acyltransferase|uniref:Acyltransferase n=1 Tax=Simplicispira hankyongi TaxID=2315688 RepID=A0A398CHJ6_9BURK|nr:acyltransferase [Simplicispira hankyongi]RID98323.1 acyltransferase [Simplicispira hankyongi]